MKPIGAFLFVTFGYMVAAGIGQNLIRGSTTDQYTGLLVCIFLSGIGAALFASRD